MLPHSPSRPSPLAKPVNDAKAISAALRNLARYEALEVDQRGQVLVDQTWGLDSFKLN